MLAEESRTKRILRFGAPGITQLVSSLGNLLVPLSASRWLNANELGLVALIYTGTQVAVQILRSWIGESFLLENARHVSHRSSFNWFYSIALVLGSLFSSMALLTLSKLAPLAAMLLGVSVGAVLGAEVLKYSLLAGGQRRRTLQVDLAWLACQVAAMALLLIFDLFSAVNLLLAWGGAAAIACSPFLSSLFPTPLRVRSRPEFPASGLGFLLDGIMVSGAPFMLISALAFFGSTEVVGEYRAATVVYLPVQLLMVALGLLLVANHLGSANSARLLVGLSSILVLYIWCVAIIINYLPQEAGVQILGLAWESTNRHIYPVAAMMTTAVGMHAVTVFNKANHTVGRVVAIRAIYAAVLILGSLVVRPASVQAVLGIVAIAQILGPLFWLVMIGAKGRTSLLAVILPIRVRSSDFGGRSRSS